MPSRGRGRVGVIYGIISPLQGEGVKKSIWFFFTPFRRKPESSVFKALRTDWTPVFTGETAENQFFHTFGDEGGFYGFYKDETVTMREEFWRCLVLRLSLHGAHR
jgi:hypothetical protein